MLGLDVLPGDEPLLDENVLHPGASLLLQLEERPELVLFEDAVCQRQLAEAVPGDDLLAEDRDHVLRGEEAFRGLLKSRFARGPRGGGALASRSSIRYRDAIFRR